MQRRLSFIISIIYVQENDAGHSTVLNTEYVWLLYNIPFPSSSPPPPSYLAERTFIFIQLQLWHNLILLQTIEGNQRLHGEGEKTGWRRGELSFKLLSCSQSDR